MLLGLGCAAALAGAAAFRELMCQACGGGRLPLGVIGATFYGCMIVAVATLGLRKPAAFLLIGAAGLHAGLVILMLTRGPVCPLCLGTAASSFAVAAMVLRELPDLRETAVAVAPWMAAGAFLLPIHPSARGLELPSTPGAPVQVAVYTRDGCPYCDQLRDDVLPRALAGIADKVEVRWIPAPPETPTPSIVLSRGSGGHLIEGLPPADFLRREVLKLVEGTP